LTIGIPGTNAVYDMTLHVLPDSKAPAILSAKSLDGQIIDVIWSENVNIDTASDRFNYILNSQGPGDGILYVTNRHNPRFYQVVLANPLPSPDFTLDVLFVGDLLGNSDFSHAKGRARTFVVRDLGAPLGQGYSFFRQDDEFDIVGGGVDIWGTSDSGHFTMSPRLGNFDMWARVASLGRSPLDNDNISKAGIVVRQDTNPNGRAATFFV